MRKSNSSRFSSRSISSIRSRNRNSSCSCSSSSSSSSRFRSSSIRYGGSSSISSRGYG